MAAALSLFAFSTQADEKAVNPQVRKIVDDVSEERIKGVLEKLVSFGTRNTMSNQDDPARGVGAARQWIFNEFKSYSPRLQVRFDKWRVKKQGRVFKDVDLYDVVAVLPGKTMPETEILVSGHYDSVNLGTRAPAAPSRRRHFTASAAVDARGAGKESQPARSRRLRRRQRHGRGDGTGARDEPVRIRQDAGVRGLRGRRAGPGGQHAGSRQGRRRRTRPSRRCSTTTSSAPK